MSINQLQGFRIKGWFKPAVTENGITQETFSLHVCYLCPNSPLTDIEKEKVYKEGTSLYIHWQNQSQVKNIYPILLTFFLETTLSESVGPSEEKRSRQDEEANDSQVVSQTVII